MGSWARAAVAPIRPTKRTNALLATCFFVVFLLREQMLQLHIRIERHVEESDHHFIPALVAPGYFFAGIRVIGIVWRIVEMRSARDLGALGKHDLFHRLVQKLPAKTVVRQVEKRFRFSPRL